MPSSCGRRLRRSIATAKSSARAARPAMTQARMLVKLMAGCSDRLGGDGNLADDRRIAQG